MKNILVEKFHIFDNTAKNKARRCLFSLILCLFIFVGCGLEDMRVDFQTTDDVFINPYIGYAVMAEDTHLKDKASLVYIDVTWKELEPVRGQLDWDHVFDSNNVSFWKNRGAHAVFRFICDYPSSEAHRDIPDWLYDMTGDGVDYEIEYGKGYCPNYSNEVFKSEHTRIIAEIADKLNQDDFVSYVQLGSLGHWGEWHTYYPAGLPKLTPKIMADYTKDYEAFTSARLLMRRPFESLPDKAGLYNDMTGDEDSTYEFLDWIKNGGEGLKAVENIWDTAPIGGEFTSGTSMETMLTDNYDLTKELISSSHMSFIGPKTPYLTGDEEYYDRAMALLSEIGYRYTVSEVMISRGIFSKTATINLTLENIGNAPIYFEAKPCLYLENSNGDIKRVEFDYNLTDLKSLDSVTLSYDFAKADIFGKKIYFGIEAGADYPNVSIAMDTTSKDGMYYLTTVR